jgi:uncharacterized protein YndB with AHSA1/START domain
MPNTKNTITVETTIHAPIEKVWKLWTDPAHITKWNSASPDWHTPKASNDVRTGGAFSFRMESLDGTEGFDFGGVYDEVVPHEWIEYTIGDGRKVEVDFQDNGTKTHITETFEAESENPPEMQKQGWQSIMNNFKKYVESNP